MSKIVLGVTAVDQKEMTSITVSTTFGNVKNYNEVKMVLIDNASKKPYKLKKGSVDLIRNKDNKGCFYPLLQLYKKYPKAQIIGIMHNDATIYEKGWDEKLLKMFKSRSIGAVGLFGWHEIDKYGIEHKPTGNPLEEAPAMKYKRVTKLTPVAALDSMCMFFPRGVIPYLKIDEDILLRHGYDKIWSARLKEVGFKACVSGFSFQHKGMAAFQDPEYLAIMKKWYDKRWGLNFPLDSIEGMMLFEGRILFVDEFGDKLPIKV
jgi:Glycosyltransferase like family